jgi:hypothetical protein
LLPASWSWLAVAISAIIFSANHRHQSWHVKALALVLGIVLGACYVKTHSLIVPIGLHMVANARHVVPLLIAGRKKSNYALQRAFPGSFDVYLNGARLVALHRTNESLVFDYIEAGHFLDKLANTQSIVTLIKETICCRLLLDKSITTKTVHLAARKYLDSPEMQSVPGSNLVSKWMSTGQPIPQFSRQVMTDFLQLAILEIEKSASEKSCSVDEELRYLIRPIIEDVTSENKRHAVEDISTVSIARYKTELEGMQKCFPVLLEAIETNVDFSDNSDLSAELIEYVRSSGTVSESTAVA